MPTLAELITRRKRSESATNQILSKLIQRETAQALGGTAGKVDARAAHIRTDTLRRLLNSGELSPDELGPRDRAMVGPVWLKQFMDVPQPGTDLSPDFLGVGGPVGAGISNFFTGAAEFAKSLPGGLAKTGASLGSDIAGNITDPLGAQGPLGPLGGRPLDQLERSMPETTKNVIRPTVDYYRQKYSGSAGDIARKALVEDPFGTVLDVGTAATLGAGTAARTGSLAARAGQTLEALGGEGVAGRVGAQVGEVGKYLKGYGFRGTRGTRPDLTIGKNIKVPREYGVSPIVRAGQRFSDEYLHRIPTIGEHLASMRAKFAQHKIINTEAGRSRILGSFFAANESKGFIQAAKQLDDNESIALSLLKNGVSMQPVRPAGGVTRGMITALDAMKQYIDASLENKLPEGYNIQQMEKLGVDPDAVRALRAKLDDPDLQMLIEDPSEAMIKASDVWDDQVDRNLQTHPIDPEEHVRRVWAPQQALRIKPEDLGDYDSAAAIEAIKDPRGAFERFSARHAEEAGGEFPIRPNYIPHELAEGTFTGSLTGIERSKSLPRVSLAQQLVGRHHPSYLTSSDMQAFLSGAMRVGTRPMTEFIHKRERFLAHEGMISSLIGRLAEKDHQGETVRVADESEMRAKGYSPDTHVALDLEGTVQFFKNETDFLKTIVSMVDEVRKDAPKAVADRADEITKGVTEFAELSGRKTVQEVVGATKPDRIVMTREAASHLRDTLETMTPARSKVGRGYDRMMSMWRSMTLSLMPRWWINTLVGSSFLTVLSGAARPKYLGAAWRYGGRGEKAAKLTQIAPELKPGIFGAELHEAESLGRRRFAPSRAIFTRVENLESFFKRAGFFHQLDKQAKAAMHQLDEVLEGFSRSPYLKDEYINNILDNHPELIDHALNEVNRFYYNYTSLGPFERRHVRRFVPFYGWYKFVTKLVYQLPFQYPGRTLVLDKMSRIAQDFEDEELGILPFDVKGAIFLNNNRSDEQYVPTFGLNPLSDFANPAAPEGTLQGMLSTQQLAPMIGAFIQAIGLDPFRGTPNELSPEDNLLTGMFGRVIDPETGEEVPGGLSGAFSTQRFLGSLMRSIPQVRTLEMMNAGGRYVYPESIPFLDEKPIPVPAGEVYEGQGPTNFLLRSFLGGWPPRSINLREYQHELDEDVKYGRSQRKSQLERLRKAGVR